LWTEQLPSVSGETVYHLPWIEMAVDETVVEVVSFIYLDDPEEPGEPD
jgi:hypothetical protein